VNVGIYGRGASWISNSAYSWIKIDLGEPSIINTITFGRDRLGNFNDGDPGQFMIAVALSDDIYADGNSHNDYMEYSQIYNSNEEGFDGVVSGPGTIEAKFDPVKARYVKITFENARTAVDEIEVFMIQPPSVASHATQRPRDPRSTFTPVPTNTLVPSKTPTLIIPTNTLLPTYTWTPRPTFTSTPRPPTSTPEPTDTPKPPTSTPRPPTDTPEPPTDTPEPPTDTPQPPTDPPPTDPPPTDPPPTDPPPADTPEPPTATAEAQFAPTETSPVPTEP
jgi:hypothetical protein